jgi:hypothetical protein
METQRLNTALRLGITTLGAFVLLSTGALASCKQGFCVKGHDEGGNHVVDFTTTMTNVSHFNLIDASGYQWELGANEREFTAGRNDAPSGTILHYRLQACAGGGFLQTSNCTPWVIFSYAVP